MKYKYKWDNENCWLSNIYYYIEKVEDAMIDINNFENKTEE